MPLDHAAFHTLQRVYQGPALEREGALIDLRRLAEREPVDYDVVEAYATALTHFERHREAADVLAGIVELEPERWETRMKLGAAYATIHLFAEARAELQAVIDRAPSEWERTEAQEILDRVATGQETATLRAQQVVALRERVASGAASEADVLLLARRLIENGMQRGVRAPIDEARTMLEQARTTHGDSAALLEALAFCYRQDDPNARLRETLQALEAIAPHSAVLDVFGDTEAYELQRPHRDAAEQAYNEAYELERAGDDDAAAAAYQRAVDTGDPEHAPAAAVNLGNLLARHDDVERARTAYRAAIDSAHTDAGPKASRALGLMLFKHGDLAAAEAAYEDAIDSGHADQAPKAMGNLAWLLEERGDKSGAQQLYERAIDTGHYEEGPAAALNLGNMLAHDGQLERARAWYEFTIDAAPPEVAGRAALNLAQVHYHQGDVERAIDAARRAASSGTEEIRAEALEAIAALESRRRR